MSASEYDYDRPWHRQPLDTDVSFALLSDYLLLRPGERKWSRVGKHLIKRHIVNASQIAVWESEHRWADRAALYDAHLMAIREDAIADMARRHAEFGAGAVSLAQRELARLGRHADRVAANDGLPLLAPRDILRFADVGIRVEREASRLPAAATSTGPDVGQLTLDELRALAGIGPGR